MEVHAHSHTARKKWTHYFWEFLMLFLAVFCGFLAEYQLEHKIEKDREKQYMRSMIEDLKSDMAMLENNISSRLSRIAMIDSFVQLMASPTRNENGNELYYYARSISPPTNIFPSDRTIQQLKSSGNLRLIRRQHISNSIMAYDQNVRQALFELGDEVQIRAEYRIAAAKVFNATIFNEMVKDEVIRKPINSPKLFSEQPQLI